jgi:hypothetical protein
MRHNRLGSTNCVWRVAFPIPETKLKQIWLGWSLGGPFYIVSDSPARHSKWLLLLKIEMSLVINFCFITHQNELKF